MEDLKQENVAACFYMFKRLFWLMHESWGVDREWLKGRGRLSHQLGEAVAMGLGPGGDVGEVGAGGVAGGARGSRRARRLRGSPREPPSGRWCPSLSVKGQEQVLGAKHKQGLCFRIKTTSS